jgi:uncharacterized protein (TIGR03067 family)
MLRLLTVCVVVLLAASSWHLLAQDASAPLQGRWVVSGAEHNGKPMTGLNGGVMTIAGRAFEIRTASGNMLKGTLRLDSTKQPWQMDMVHADGVEWEAIYDVSGDTLRLNYVVKGEKDPRPASFATSEKTEESLIVLRRQGK